MGPSDPKPTDAHVSYDRRCCQSSQPLSAELWRHYKIIEGEKNPEEPTATQSQRMSMLLLPWRHAPPLSVMQSYFKIHLSQDERSEREEFTDHGC